jgi:hypothetical protein
MTDYGYSYEPDMGGGKFLTLRKRGDTVKIRLASTPIHFQKEWEGKPREKFAWVVIDRADGKAKVFTSSVSIYLSIKKFADDEEWGEPTQYDFAITRTEESTSNYYSVVPSPKKSKLTKEELQAVEESEIDLEKMFPAGKGTNTFGEVKEGQELVEPEDPGFTPEV